MRLRLLCVRVPVRFAKFDEAEAADSVCYAMYSDCFPFSDRQTNTSVLFGEGVK